ncbi:hypothetical protein ACIBHY_03265 [Nonomuraea sp. NPDC050547]|uniref:hypothetical protein n=1 Tax=Nonomuraea sp. NPDC050547 TaxID=3364368 RepID=UPI0037963103
MARNPALVPLDTLVGEWSVEAHIGGHTVSGGRAVFEWIEGGAFLAFRAYGTAEGDAPQEWQSDSPLPSVCLIGVDDATGAFSYLHSDARGVHRVYQMTLADGVWRVWRDAPGFHQRLRRGRPEDRRGLGVLQGRRRLVPRLQPHLHPGHTGLTGP